MNELDDAWDLALAEAKERARAAGQRDIADYVDLRRRNDLLRRTAIDWLTNALNSLAADANRRGAAIQIERHDAHQFKVGSATMVGCAITLRHGVRALTLECGWPRTPRDGIIRGGGLARAHIKHFGRRRLNIELKLTQSPKGSPQWFLLQKDDTWSLITEASLRAQLSILTED